MPIYKYMLEAFRLPTDDGFAPGIAWVTDGKHILLGAKAGFEPQLAPLNTAVNAAYGRGLSGADIWNYWASQGGQGQLSIRTIPQDIEAADLDQALNAALARVYKA